MKKYLMTGIAALALCVGFTSCSHDIESLSQEEINQRDAQQMVLNYQKAFVATFGQPASNHHWGFINYSQARTRNHGIDGAINVNGNMWTECPGVRVDEEVNAIFNYVKNGTEWMLANDKPFSTTAPENLNGYFVTQVRSGNNNYADNTYPLTYKQDGGQISNVGQYMNHLQIAFNENPSMADLNSATSHDNISGWEHINNFNASANIDWGNAESAEKGNTKVEDKGAFDFAYHSSYDDQYHNKWILVDGANISSDPYYADFYYVCFDFESVPKGNSTFYKYTDSNGQSQQDELAGTYFTNEELAAELVKQGITDRKNINIYRYLNGDKMVKGDNKYTDWIIRITKGAIEPEWDLRIIAEDLNATAQEGDTEDSDWDFNDVVLDVKFLEGTDQVKIRVTAAGATLPIRINGEDALEVHGLYGQPTNIMINTGAAAAGYPRQAYESNGVYPTAAIFERTISGVDASYGEKIKIEVKKLVNGVETWFELEAKPGQPASKIGVLPDYIPCTERQDIRNRYTQFVAWVAKQNPVYWWRTNTNE